MPSESEPVLHVLAAHRLNSDSGMETPLATQIVRAGGKVLIVGDNSIDLSRVLPAVAEEQRKENVRFYRYGDRQDTAWLRDTFGAAVIRGTHHAMPIAHDARKWNAHGVMPDLIKKSGLGELDLKLSVQWGNRVPLGKDTLVVGSNVFESNRPQTQEQVLKELQKLGRERIITLPTSGTLFHSDLQVCQVGGTVFVPSIPHAVVCASYYPGGRLSPTRLDRLRGIAETLDQSSALLGGEGFLVKRIPLHPGGVFQGFCFSSGKPIDEKSLTAYLSRIELPQVEPVPRGLVSPVNVTQVRAADGRLTVLVPFPVFFNTLLKEYSPNPFAREEARWKDEIRAAYLAAGAYAVRFTYYNTWHERGQNHCRSGALPIEAFERFR
jgi:hypothetical protein